MGVCGETLAGLRSALRGATRLGAPSRPDRTTDTGSFPGALAMATTSAGPEGTHTSSHRRHAARARLWRPLALLLFLLGPVLAVLANRGAAAYEDQRVRADVEGALLQHVHALNLEARSFVDVLHAARWLFDSSERVRRDEFQVFTREALDRYPTIVGIGWAPAVLALTREDHERSVRNQGWAPDYRVTPYEGGVSVRPVVHFPLLFLEPIDDHVAILGRDLASDAQRAATVERALVEREAALSEPVGLLQRPAGRLGALLVLAVYRHGVSPRDASSAAGVVVLAFHFDDFLEGVRRHGREAGAQPIALELFDASVAPRRTIVRTFPTDEPVEDELAAEESVRVGGQDWVLRGVPTASFLVGRRGFDPLVIGLAVLLAWELFAACLVALVRSVRAHALHRQARTVHRVLRSLGEGVVVADGSGHIHLANDAARRLLGDPVDLSESGKWPLRAGFVRPDGRTPFDTGELPVDRAARGDTVPEEEILVRNAQSQAGVWVMASATPLLDEAGRPRGGVMVLRDVTAQKQADESARRLSSAVEQTADAVWIVDRAGHILYANPAFEASTGWSLGEVAGHSQRLLSAGPEGEAVQTRLWETVLSGHVFRGTVVTSRRDGATYRAEVTATPMKDAAGHVTHGVVVSKDMTERLRLQEQDVEMRLAAQVQQRLYPHQPPDVPGLDLAARVLSAEATCGDYCDFIEGPDGSLALVVGDVSGHGFGPALVMAETRAYLRSLAAQGCDPAEILHRLNGHLVRDLGEGLFVTLLYVAVEPGTRRITFASAGQTPGLVVGADGGLRRLLSATGPALGLFADQTWESRDGLCLDAGDVVVLMTDGATECPGSDGALFDEEGVLEVVRAHRHESAKDILAHLEASLRAFSGRAKPRDDITLLVCKAKPVPSARETRLAPETTHGSEHDREAAVVHS